MTDTNLKKTNRLEGLDVARFLAFAGMVIVNFNVVMVATDVDSTASRISGALEGRAAATFVVLAGIGLGLASLRAIDGTLLITIKRALFLLVVGLLNMLIFEADIIHYYSFFFLCGAVLLPLSTRTLVTVIICLNIAFVFMIIFLDYDKGWNWDDLSYQGFWTAQGFVRNLFFNGWHPVIPWLGFLLFGFILSRQQLSETQTQHRLIMFGAASLILVEIVSRLLLPLLSAIDPELAILTTTKPVPPMPLYFLAGISAACVVIGVCLRFTEALRVSGLLAVVTPAGRQTLTLYIAHILIGMGTLESLGMLGNQTAQVALIASLLFCLAATIYAVLWKQLFKRGPVEAMMRKLAG